MVSKNSLFQIIVISIALLLVVGLYFFGKTTQPVELTSGEAVLNDQKEQTISLDTDEIESEAIQSLTEEEKNRLGTTSQDEKLAFWQSVDQYEMAAITARELAEQKNGYSNWDIAGDTAIRAYREVSDSTHQIYFVQHAVSSYQKALEHQQNVDTKLKLALIYTKLTGATMEGVLLLREVVEADPSNVQATFELGLLSLQSGQLDKALERFEALIDLEPDFIEPYILKAQILLEQDKKQEAKDVIDAAMSKTKEKQGLKILQEMKNSIK